MDSVHDLDFDNAASSVGRDELESAAAAIRAELRAMGSVGVAE
jgi:hypothetical protein